MTFRNALFSFVPRALTLFALAATALANQTYVGVFFDHASIPAGGTAAFDMQLRENDGTAFTNGSITVTYPTGLVNDGQYGDPLITENCSANGAIITRTAGTNQLVVTNVSLGAFQFCDIYVRITGSTFGSYTITIPPGSFSSSTPSTTNSATTSATLAIVGPVSVTTNADSGVGSLRDAINTVNANCGTATGINFNIPGTGPHVIGVLTALPAVTCTNAFINGYSQPGSAVNTMFPPGNNASIQVVLDGTACTSCDGLDLNSYGIHVSGLAIHSFGGQGIASAPGSFSNYIHGNYIGTDAGGMSARPNQGHGVLVVNGFAVVGGTTADMSNLISSNVGAGINAGSSGGALQAENNQIGGKRDGSAGNGNSVGGIYLNGANYQRNYVDKNYITSNGNAGITVVSTVADYVVYGNASFGNGGIGFDIGADGATANDDVSPPYDGDGVLNYPVITSVSQSGGITTVSGYLHSVANRGNTTIYLYSTASASAVNEGQYLIDYFTAPVDASGVATFSRPISGSWDNVSAQVVMDVCNDACYRSSEYSPKVAAVVVNPLVVTNTNDSGTGSLRDAISYVNASCAAQTITFNIPGTGVQTINPASPLPALTCAGMTIDGRTQPGAATNTDPQHSNAVIVVEINGSLINTAYGLNIAAPNVTIAGLALTGFSFGTGIHVTSSTGAGNIWGSFIGIAPDGVTAKPNNSGIVVDGGAAIVIGGTMTTPHSQRNVISGNGTGIVLSAANGSVVQDNLIGTNAAGNAAVSNGTGISVTTSNVQIIYNVISGHSGGDAGVHLTGATGTLLVGNLIGTSADGLAAIPNSHGVIVTSSPGTTIGTPGTPNTISGNQLNGILATASSGITIKGNYIGVNPFGNAMGNGGDGIYIDSSTGIIGGPGTGEGNVIANNAQGVVIPSSTVQVTGNSIYGNTNLGINLVGDGVPSVPANDNCDVDGGGNGLANFPVLSTASLSGGMLTVTGTHNSTASTTFRIEYFANAAADNAGNRAGRTYLGFATVTTDGACNATINATISPGAAVNVGDTITATSTDPGGNTSSFSNAVTVAAPAPAISTDFASLTFAPQLAGTTATQRITVTNSGSAPLTVSSLAPPPAYSVLSTCVAPVPPSSTCTLDVSFSPGAGGTFSGNLVINSDASNAPALAIPLTGISMDPPTFAITTAASRTPGQTTPIDLFISNPAANPRTYAGFSVTLAFPAGFSLDTSAAINATCGATAAATGSPPNALFAGGGGGVSAGTTCDVMGAQLFAPTTPGTYTFTIPAGGFTITSPFKYSNPSPISAVVTVALAPAPGVSLSPPSLSFAARNVFTTSPSQPVVVTNTGNATLNISTIFTSGDFAQTNACPASLAPNATCTVNVTFTPDIAGPISGALIIMDDAAGSPHQVPLSGTGIALTPAVSLTPPSLTFASRTVSTTSPAQTVTLGNTGTGALTISSITVSGDFAFTSACGASVAAGGSCTIDVTFTPLVPGTRAGAVTIADNASGSPHTVPLTGTGASGAAPVASVSPGAVDFSPQQVGSESPQDIVTVSNTGNAPLTFSSITVTGDFAIVTPTGTGAPACPTTLAPASSCRIALVFRPTGVNLRQGVLTIVTNGATVTLNVIGTGMIPEPPQLTMPSSLDFGTQPVGTKSSGHSVALKNVSPYVATITELTASGDFAVSDTCATIAAGATCSPLVTFQPAVIGPSTGALTIRTLRDANPYTVTLTGTGVENLVPVLELSATHIGFGNAFIAMGVSRDVTLKNTGQAPLAIAGILTTGDYFTDGACLTTIAPGATCTVHVTFFPTVPGGRTGVLQITSNAFNTPTAIVNLGGTGCFIPTPARARAGVLLCGG